MTIDEFAAKVAALPPCEKCGAKHEGWSCEKYLRTALATAQAERDAALQRAEELAHELRQTAQASQHFEQQRDAALAERDALKKQACGCVWRPGIEDRDRGDRPFMTCLHHAMLYDRIAEFRRVLRECHGVLMAPDRIDVCGVMAALLADIAAVLAQDTDA